MKHMRYLFILLLLACSKEECEDITPALEINISSTYDWQYMKIYDWFETTTTGGHTFSEHPTGTFAIDIGAGPGGGEISVRIRQKGKLIYSKDTIGHNPRIIGSIELK